MDKFTESVLAWSIISFGGIISMIIGLDTCFDKRHGNHKLYWGYFLIKASVTSWYASAEVYRPPSETIEILWMILTCVFAVASFVVLWYTWDAEPLKIGIFGVTSDAISGTCMIASSVIVNTAAGRGLSHEYLRVSLFEAVILAAISVIMYSLAIKMLRRAIEIFRDYDIKHRRTIALLIVLAIAGLSSSNLTSRMELIQSWIMGYVMLVMLLAMMGFLIVRRLSSQVRKRKLIKSKNEITEAYLTALEQQSAKIDEQEQLLDYIRNEIRKVGTIAQDSEMEVYIESLKAQAEALKHGAYSGNITLDAVLSVFQERFRDLDIDIRFDICDMSVAGERPAEISMHILNWAEAMYTREANGQSHSGSVDYKINKIGNQYVFELAMPAVEKRSAKSSIRKKLETCISKDDPISDRIENEKRVISLMTEGPTCLSKWES